REPSGLPSDYDDGSSVTIPPAIVAALAPSICPVGAQRGATISTGINRCRPPRLTLTVVRYQESPFLTLTAPDSGFPEAIGGLREMPPGRHEPKTCQTARGA